MLLPWLVGYGDIRILVTVYGLTPIARDDVLRHDLLDPTQTLSKSLRLGENEWFDRLQIVRESWGLTRNPRRNPTKAID